MKLNPTQLYRLVAAVIALVAYFLPSGAWPLVLAIAVVLIGPGVAGVDNRYRRDLEQLDKGDQ